MRFHAERIIHTSGKEGVDEESREQGEETDCVFDSDIWKFIPFPRPRGWLPIINSAGDQHDVAMKCNQLLQHLFITKR